jgi:hypothetical protein
MTQASRVAATLKAAGGAAHAAEVTSFAIVMDDKILKVEMPWATIRSTSEAGIAEYIFNLMREDRPTQN